MKLKPILLAAMTLFTPLAQAELINYHFTAVVTSIFSDSDRELETVSINDILTATVTLDTNADVVFADNNRIYWGGSAVIDVNATLGDYSLEFSPDSNELSIMSVSQLNNNLGNVFDSGFSAQSNVVDNWEATNLSLFAYDTDAVAFATQTIPLSFEGADVISGSVLLVSTLPELELHSVAFAVTSIEVTNVPLPAAFWLLLWATAPLALLRVKRQNRTGTTPG